MAAIAAPLRGYWQVRIYDKNGKLVDLPQADISSIDVYDVINGGSAQGTIKFKRNFNQIGALANGYTVLVWFWRSDQSQPTDPYYAGHIVDFDQEQLSASGEVTIYLEGDAKLLDAAIVTEQANPGINGNPNLDAGLYLQHLDAVYRPPNFIAGSIPSPMFNMFPTNFDGTKLGAAIDTVSKQGRDVSGALWTWFVRTKHDLTRQLVVQKDQNPNQIAGPLFKHLFVGSTVDEYKIQNIYRDIINTVAVYGGKDPITGQQVYGVYSDAASVSTYGAIEDKISVPALQTQAGCQAYATVWLTLHAYPQAQGTMRMLYPDFALLAGTWVQCWETPATPSAGNVIKQVRIAQVRVLIEGERIEQYLYTASPVPYLDEAVYRMGLNVSVSQAIQNSPVPANKQQLYVRSGGFITATGSSGGNGQVAIAATTAVFPSGQVIANALALTSLVDNSGGSNNGQGGDGNFTVSLNSSGNYVITKGLRPANTSTQQNLCGVVVQGGAIIAGGTSDLRTLNGLPALTPGTTPSIASGSAVLSYPNGTGGPTYDAQVVVNLGSNASQSQAGIYDLELWVAAHGAGNATPQYWSSVSPNANGQYTLLYQALPAGTQWDLYVGFRDNAGLLGGQNVSAPTNCLLLATTAANPISLPGGGLQPVPAGFTFSDSDANVSYTAVNAGAYGVKFDLTVTAVSNYGTPANWLNSIDVLVAPTGTQDWSLGTSIKTSAFGTFSGVAINGLGAGQAYDVKIQINADRPGSYVTSGVIFTTAAQYIGQPSMQTMPSSIKTNGPTIGSASYTARTAGKGIRQILQVTFTETDFSSVPSWIDGIYITTRINGTTQAGDDKRIDPSVGSAGTYTSMPIWVSAGDNVDVGIYYTDQSGQKSAIGWPSALQGISDPNGDVFDSGDGYYGVTWRRAPSPLRVVIDSSSNFLNNLFAGAKLQTNGMLTAVDGKSTSLTQGFVSGTTLHVEGTISSALASGAGLVIGNLTDGYYVTMQLGNLFEIYKYVGGVPTRLASTAVTYDTNPHHYQLTVTIGASNTLEATIDETRITATDSSNTPNIANPAPVTAYTGGSAGTLSNFAYTRSVEHYGVMPGSYQSNFDWGGSWKKSTAFNANIPNLPSNWLSDVALAYSSTTSSVSVWITNAAVTGLPSWTPADGSPAIAPPAGACGSASSPLVTVTGLSSGETVYFVVWYNITSRTFTVNNYAGSPPTDAQVAAALADGQLLVVMASANSSKGIVANGGGGAVGGGGGHNYK